MSTLTLEVPFAGPQGLSLELKAYLSRVSPVELVQRAVEQFPASFEAGHGYCPNCRQAVMFQKIHTEKQIALTGVIVESLPAERCPLCGEVQNDLELGAILEQGLQHVSHTVVQFDQVLGAGRPPFLSTAAVASPVVIEVDGGITTVAQKPQGIDVYVIDRAQGANGEISISNCGVDASVNDVSDWARESLAKKLGDQ